MGTELVTGHKGTVHVDSADDASLYAAIVGKGEYVLQLGTKFACTMTTANKAHIASGHGLMQGYHWLVDNEGEDLTIQNGTQGQKRNDLIVARYECDSKNNNIESVALKVIKGTPTTGTPSDPAYVHGDILDGNALVNEMPLWRIPLNGITVGTPVKLFAESASAQDRWDSVSQINRGVVMVNVDGSTGSASVVFDKPFLGYPAVTVSVQTAYPNLWSVSVSNITPTGFTACAASLAGQTTNLYVHWIAAQ